MFVWYVYGLAEWKIQYSSESSCREEEVHRLYFLNGPWPYFSLLSLSVFQIHFIHIHVINSLSVTTSYALPLNLLNDFIKDTLLTSTALSSFLAPNKNGDHKVMNSLNFFSLYLWTCHVFTKSTLCLSVAEGKKYPYQFLPVLLMFLSSIL